MEDRKSVYFDIKTEVETFKREIFAFIHVRRDDPRDESGESAFFYAHDIDRHDWFQDPREILEFITPHPDPLRFKVLVKMVERIESDPELKKQMIKAADGDTLSIDMKGVSFHEHDLETW